MLSYKHFIDLMQRSDTAAKLGIDNSIPKELDRNLRSLFYHYMSLADSFPKGKSIYITSGYRCPRLNKAVGGVFNSNHTKCCALDFAFNFVSSKSEFLETFDRLKNYYLSYYQKYYDADYRAALQRFNHHFIVYPERFFVHYQIIPGFMEDYPVW